MMDLIRRIRYGRARVKVEITCAHGAFIPGVYTPGGASRRYGCPECALTVRVSTFRGPITW